jgi:hypothetical protein
VLKFGVDKLVVFGKALKLCDREVIFDVSLILIWIKIDFHRKFLAFEMDFLISGARKRSA